MKLGILLCDHVQQALQPEFGDYPAMFEHLLSKLNIPLEIMFFSAVDGELPVNIDVCDAYMTSGSKAGVNDGLPWILELEQFVRKLYHSGKGFVGICFGHQLIARALGGKVQRSDKGWGIGVASSMVVKPKNWMLPRQNQLNLVVSHQDQVTDLPLNAEVLMSDDFCPYSMIQVGQNFLGLQGHPEFSLKYSYALMMSRKDTIPKQRLSEGAESLHLQADDLLVMSWLINFLQMTISNK